MLQDGVFVRGDWIKDTANQATAVKFLEASFKGWIYCRDHLSRVHEHRAEERAGAAEGASALADERGQRAHLAEQARHRRSWIRSSSSGRPTIAKTYKVIKKPATKASYRTDLARKAVANLQKQGLDVNGKGFKKKVVDRSRKAASSRRAAMTAPGRAAGRPGPELSLRRR